MARRETIFRWVFALAFTGLLACPALGHRKYRPNPLGPPRWRLVPHSHKEEPSLKPTISSRSEVQRFDLLGGAFDLVAGAWQAVSDTIGALLGGDRDLTAEAEKVRPARRPSGVRRYRYVPNHSGNGPRWIRKRL